ncbi:8349_t:CDS:2 [Paraglomus brasilianum]|uniref:8349_t:CDS:1 n=1 Tax=Paraglomus brasilianum TaxID=144538 RepID=A0A9N9F385_9GLOM|nr:8349_t:CDS:2 [Paraglomus brasilianum]
MSKFKNGLSVDRDVDDPMRRPRPVSQEGYYYPPEHVDSQGSRYQLQAMRQYGSSASLEVRKEYNKEQRERDFFPSQSPPQQYNGSSIPPGHESFVGSRAPSVFSEYDVSDYYYSTRNSTFPTSTMPTSETSYDQRQMPPANPASQYQYESQYYPTSPNSNLNYRLQSQTASSLSPSALPIDNMGPIPVRSSSRQGRDTGNEKTSPMRNNNQESLTDPFVIIPKVFEAPRSAPLPPGKQMQQQGQQGYMKQDYQYAQPPGPSQSQRSPNMQQQTRQIPQNSPQAQLPPNLQQTRQIPQNSLQAQQPPSLQSTRQIPSQTQQPTSLQSTRQIPSQTQQPPRLQSTRQIPSQTQQPPSLQSTRQIPSQTQQPPSLQSTRQIPSDAQPQMPPQSSSAYDSEPYIQPPPQTRPAETTRKFDPHSIAEPLSIDDYVQQAIKLHESNQLEQSTQYLKIAAEEGSPIGMTLYGLALRHGWVSVKMVTGKGIAELGCQINPRLAFKYLQKAASSAVDDINMLNSVNLSATKGELVLAIYELGVCFRHGWGVPKDKVHAAHYFEMAAKLGDPDAQNDIGMCYYKGEGVKKDLKIAAKYYRMAHAQGYGTMGNSWIFKEKYNEDE